MAIAPKPAILEQDHQGTRPRRWSREVGIDGDLAARPSGVPSSEAFLGVESPISLPWYLRVMGHLGLGVRLEGGGGGLMRRDFSLLGGLPVTSLAGSLPFVGNSRRGTRGLACWSSGVLGASKAEWAGR